MPGFQSTRLVTEGALEPFFCLYTDDSIQGNPETCKQSSIMLNYEVKNNYSASYSLKELYEKFNKYNFESPHKSFIVNMLYVKRIKGFDILLENGDIVPLAQKRAVVFKNRFNDFLQSTFDRI